MLEIIFPYCSSFIVVILIAIIILILLRLDMKKQVNEICFYLVTKAEQKFGSGTGEIKYASVVTWLYDRMPTICRWLFTKRQIDTIIESAVNRMQSYFNTGNKNSIKLTQ